MNITRMNQYYRNKALRSELYSYIRDIGRTQGLMIKNAGIEDGGSGAFYIFLKKKL